jgi:hypothetical protein
MGTGYHKTSRIQKDKNMNKLKNSLAVSVLVVLSVASFAQIQGAQTLSTTTLSAAIPTTSTFGIGSNNAFTSNVCLASLTNVTATVSIGTTLWVDTEAMTVVTNSVPSTGTCLLVQRGAFGTKAEGHQSGRKVYVGRPNLFQQFDVAGTCYASSTGLTTSPAQLPAILPWINITDGKRYNCYSDGNWFWEGLGSASTAITTISAFCNTIPAQNVAEYLNYGACTGQTTATWSYTVATNGELANLTVQGSAVAANANVITVYKNGVATAITCTVAIAAKTCTDTTHGVATVIGDYIQFLDTVGNTTTETFANPSATVGLYGQ